MSYETSDIELGPTWRRDLKQNGRRSSTSSSSSTTAGSLPIPSSRGRALSASTTNNSQQFPALARPLTRPNSVWERGLPRRSLDEDRYQRRSIGQISPTEPNRRFSQPLYRHNHHVPSLIQNLKPSQTPIRNVRPVNAKLESSQTSSQQDSGFRSLGTIRQKKSTVVETMDQNQNHGIEQIPPDEMAFCSTLCPDWGPDNDRPDDRPLLSDEVRQWARKNPREASQLRERAKVKRARGLLDHSDERVLAALETSNI